MLTKMPTSHCVDNGSLGAGKLHRGVSMRPRLGLGAGLAQVGATVEIEDMAGSVNKVILVGNLGADPDIKRTQDGRPIANLSIATSDTWRDKNTGERKEKTEWHRVVIFNEGLCKVAEQYLKKGAKVYIEGALQTRKWQDKDGKDKYSTEVVLNGYGSTLTMLDKPDGGENRSVGQNSYANATGRSQPSGGAGFNDDIPFAPEWR